jgi:hypothetical protein
MVYLHICTTSGLLFICSNSSNIVCSTNGVNFTLIVREKPITTTIQSTLKLHTSVIPIYGRMFICNTVATSILLLCIFFNILFEITICLIDARRFTANHSSIRKNHKYEYQMITKWTGQQMEQKI